MANFSIITAFLSSEVNLDNRLIRVKAIKNAINVKGLSEVTKISAINYINDYTNEHFLELNKFLGKSGKSRSEILDYFIKNSSDLMKKKFQDCISELKENNSI